MPHESHDPTGAAKRSWLRKGLFGFGVVAVVLLIANLFWPVRSARPRLSFSAGASQGHRHELAELLAEEADRQGLRLGLRPCGGSVEAIELVARGELDAAMVQGGLESRPGVRQIAVLQNEPLHIFVRRDLPIDELTDLEGRRLNLSTQKSGSRRLASEVLAYAGMGEGDYEDLDLSYGELLELDANELPDGFFFVSTLPSSIATALAERGQYQMLDVPFAESLEQRSSGLVRTTIPAFYYSARPPTPAADVEAIAAPLAVIVREELPEDAVLGLLEAIFEGDFAYRGRIGPIDARGVLERHDHPLHAAVRRYHRRDEPIVRGDWIESVENARSFVVSALVAGFLLWRWYTRRQAVRFDQFIDAVSKIEREAMAAPPGASDQIADLERRLSDAKAEALDLFSEGKLGGDEHFTAFLTHVADVRRVLLAAREEREFTAGAPPP